MTEQTIFEDKYFLKNEELSYLKKNRDPLIKWILFAFASVATVFVFLIIIFLFVNGAPFFVQVPLGDFFFGTNWLPSAGDFGALPIIIDTLLVTLGAIIIALPLGILTAIFIAELAPPLLRKILKFSVEILAGIPSIVYGFFGVVVLNTWIRDIFGMHEGRSWLSGSLILAIMALPTIVSVCEDAIRAVPDYYREASYAMGATKWQTIRKVVIPAGMSGITAAMILGIGRALGETMAMTLVLGNVYRLPEPLTNMLSQVAVITSTIATNWGPTVEGSIEQKSLLALGIVLFVMALLVNTLSNIIMTRVRRKFTGQKPKERFSELKESNVYKLLVRYKQWIITALAIILVIIILPDISSQIFGAFLIFGLSLVYYVSKIVPKQYKRYVVYSVLLSFLGWVLSTWIGVFLAISLCCVIFTALFFLKRISTVLHQRIWFIVIYASSAFAVFAVGLLIYYIVVTGAPVFFEPGFLTGVPSNSGREGGIFPAIIGTLQLTVGSILFALPLGMFAGIYLSEYAGDNKITKFIRAGIDNLNGTPSIIFGLFGVVFFLLFVGLPRSLLVGILTLGLMILPTIIRTTEEAVKAIPQSFREGSLALGSSKFQGILKIVVPAAIPGIVTGAVLGMGRSAGETAPIMFTAVRSHSTFITFSLLNPVMALTYHLFRLSGEVTGGLERAAGTALTLLLLVLVLYSFAFIIRIRYEKRKQW
jgi:phosphate transport system permease protein